MRRCFALLLLLLLIPAGSGAESLTGAIDETVNGLDLSGLEAALAGDSPFAATGACGKPCAPWPGGRSPSALTS